MQRKEFKKKSARDASNLKVGIAVAQFNRDITGPMYDGALEVLKAWKVRKKNITIMRVPGSFELPFACEAMLRRRKLDAVVAIGCIIRGETDHDKYLASAVAHGLTEISVARGVPVAFGVITPNTLEQARVRSRGRTNHAVYATEAALSAALEARAL